MAPPPTKPLCEVRVYSRRHRYAGTLDVLGHWDGSPVLLDYKTGSPRDVACDLQTAGYMGALLEMTANGDAPEALTFEPLTHTYRLNGTILPSVTQILQRAGLIDFSSVPGAILQAAKDRGSAVHQALHYYNEGDLDSAFTTDFPQYAGYLSAWVRFLDESGFEFATAMDLAAITHIKRFAIQLRKDGTYRPEPYEKASDFAEFLALRQAQAIVERRRGAWVELAESA